MPDDDFENQINADEYSNEYDFEADLQRNRARQERTTPIGETTEKTDSNLNIIELMLALFLALGVDFGIGLMGAKLAAGAAAIPGLGKVVMAAIFLMTKIATFSVAMILGLWSLFRLHIFPWLRFGAIAFIEFIPFLGELAPGWTAFVLIIIIKEKIMPMLQKYGAPAAEIAGAIPLPQTQAAAKAIKIAELAAKTTGKT